MKQTLLLIVCTVFVTVLHAQSPTLTPTINYGIGDKQITLFADTVGVTPGAAGINQVWDFSKLKQDSAMDSTIVNYVDSKKALYSGDFKTANLAGETVYRGGFSYTFYDVTNAAINELGIVQYDSSMMASNGVKYKTPFTQLTYPVQFGYTSSASYNTTPFGNNVAYSKGTYNVKADAYGTMKIRNVQYDSVLRMYTVEKEEDSASLGGFASLIFYDTRISYTYYTPGKKSPILTISYTSTTQDTTKPGAATKTVTFNDFDHVQLASIASEKNKGISFSLFPNPAKGTVQISLSADKSSEAEITITNELGQVVKPLNRIDLQAGDNQISLDLQRIQPGIYFVNMVSNGQIGRQKLVID